MVVNFQFKQLERRSLKKSELQRDCNPWPPRYRCDALPTELWSHTCSVGRTSHLYRGGYGFESRWSPDFFRPLLPNCLNWKINCDDHSSLSSTSAVQIWIISYILHVESIESGIVPDVFKIFKVNSVFKTGAMTDPGNYRPIAVLSPFAKISRKTSVQSAKSSPRKGKHSI